MSILIEGMKMPKTGLYFVGVDNTDGRDKTVITVERMLGNRDVRQIVGSFELITVPEPHGRLIDADALDTGKMIDVYIRGDLYRHEWNIDEWLNSAPTVIPASEEGIEK